MTLRIDRNPHRLSFLKGGGHIGRLVEHPNDERLPYISADMGGVEEFEMTLFPWSGRSISRRRRLGR
jgi:hypothetical protein